MSRKHSINDYYVDIFSFLSLFNSLGNPLWHTGTKKPMLQMRNLQFREAKGLPTIAATHWLTRTQESSLWGSFQWHYISSTNIPGTVPSPNPLYLSTLISFKITITSHQLPVIPRNLSPWKPEFPWSLVFSQVFHLNELPGGGEGKDYPFPCGDIIYRAITSSQGPTLPHHFSNSTRASDGSWEWEEALCSRCLGPLL